MVHVDGGDADPWHDPEKLGELRNNSLLSDDEYAAAKAQLLS